MYLKKILEETQKDILDMMDEYGTDWTKPWTETMAKSFPINHVTEKPYNGFNIFWLSLACNKKGFATNRWATYDQWFQLGGGQKEKVDGKWKITKPSKYNVKAKEKSTRVFYWELKKYEDKENIDKNGDPEIKSRWFLKVWNVFNIYQVEGIEYEEPEKPEAKFKIDDFEYAENYVKNCKPDIRFGGGVACYSPILDYIQMPSKESFNDIDGSNAGQNYYSTLLHELVHWTGHKDRCNRKFSFTKGSDYAFEELVAETGSAMSCVMLGITNKPRPDHAKYLNGWKKAIKDNPRAIFSAFSKSNKAIQFLDELAFSNARKSAKGDKVA